MLAYNRASRTGERSSNVLDAVRERFTVRPGPAIPAQRGEIAMYVQGRWWTLQPITAPDPSDAIGALDVSVLQENLLAPVLNIADIRTDKRVDFVGGARGTDTLEKLVDSARRGAFSRTLYLAD